MTRICRQCAGKRYPLQCRALPAWRRRHGAPEDCPHGQVLKRLSNNEQRTTSNALLCRHGSRYTEGCCDGWRVLCRHPQHPGHYRLSRCRTCPDYEAADGNAPAPETQDSRPETR